MKLRLSMFTKIVIMVVLLLTPVFVLYSYSNRVANNVIQDQLQSSNLNQLSFFLFQLDSHIENLSMFPVILSHDPYIREFVDPSVPPGDTLLREQSRVQEKLGLQSVSSAWSNDLTLLMPREKKVISSNIFVNGSDAGWPWQQTLHGTWTYGTDVSRGGAQGTFSKDISEPSHVQTYGEARAVYQVRFPVQNISEWLDIYKKDKQSDPFLYSPGQEPIVTSTAAKPAIRLISDRLSAMDLAESGQTRMVIGDTEHLVSYVKSRQLGWYLIDYVPEQRILTPITKTRNGFYGSIGLLLLAGVLGSFLLYRHVQRPLVTLIRGVQRVARGDLSARVKPDPSSREFHYLIGRFNGMAEQIQELVEDVYAEKLRSREAELKQLQSQIHPHFLYNSLFFIINSALLDDKDAVVRMAESLAEFCRYSTRVETQSVKLREELELVRHYLTIQNMRMQRLEYEVSVPESMLEEKVPRLLLQPLVENAIVHGIEHRVGGGFIRITGEQTEKLNRIVIEDSGKGLTSEELLRLTAQLNEPMTEQIGCGTWNVHRRLYYQFGEGSGLSFEHAVGGGVRAVLEWNRSQPVQGGAKDGTALNRG
ncbi:sensor histidine kinase [Paenibacillus silviterrae]|uniref:sensor histidine kinase n=1 Tax=Paenibacillus silviterrae TaxID=3242194 RepID=UPI002543E7FA|nr:sensor histidine kinase [Paenibacillus chinjuensis]